jgi:hypothetical protein
MACWAIYQYILETSIWPHRTINIKMGGVGGGGSNLQIFFVGYAVRLLLVVVFRGGI